MDPQRAVRPIAQCSGPSRTKQAPTQACNINAIMARYHRTGILGSLDAMQRRQNVFMDVSNVGDFRDVSERIRAANEAFLELDPRIRSRFRHDPAQLLDFIANKENRDEAVALGLVNPVPVPSVHNTGTSDTVTQKTAAEAVKKTKKTTTITEEDV